MLFYILIGYSRSRNRDNEKIIAGNVLANIYSFMRGCLYYYYIYVRHYHRPPPPPATEGARRRRHKRRRRRKGPSGDAPLEGAEEDPHLLLQRQEEVG